MFRLTKSIQLISQKSNYRSSMINLSINNKRFINDGTIGQKTKNWSLSSSSSSSSTKSLLIFQNFSKQGKKLFGWLISLLTILIIWPFGIIQIFNKFNNVPTNLNTSQVQLKRIGLNKFESIVEIPNIYVKLNKEEEDDDE